MKFIMKFFKSKIQTSPTKLGRWNLHYDPVVVNSKVDQANEDHCGCCNTRFIQENRLSIIPILPKCLIIIKKKS